jgi:hypothetical protein
MAKIKNPVRLSAYFGVAEDVLARLGVLNPTLNADTKLFIDPFLIPDSSQPEISIGGYQTYRRHFESVIKLLSASKAEGDMPWRNARRLIAFPEIKWTCLGYGRSQCQEAGQEHSRQRAS